MQPLTDSTLPSLELKEVTAILIKHHGLHEGLYDLAFELQMGVGRFALDPGPPLPGAIFGIRSVGLVRATDPGPATVDAAEVNPPSKRTRVTQRKAT